MRVQIREVGGDWERRNGAECEIWGGLTLIIERDGFRTKSAMRMGGPMYRASRHIVRKTERYQREKNGADVF